ncbi:GreA/GreB family elongation factor [Chloroflexota bacterium]
MTKDSGAPTLGEAATLFLASLKPAERDAGQQDVNRFVRWFDRARPMAGLRVPEVGLYAERLPADGNLENKLKPVRAFLSYARKQGWCKSNLSIHLKAKKSTASSRPLSRRPSPESVSLSQDKYDELKAELADLKVKSLELVEEIRRAAADKDFKENAPLHAARERRGHVEGRVIELEATLKAAVVIGDRPRDAVGAGVGDRVTICDLASGDELCCRLVSPREADAGQGKISSASPIGRAIMGKHQGETVEIKAPVGILHYRIERLER